MSKAERKAMAQMCLEALAQPDAPTIRELAEEAGMEYQAFYRLLRSVGYSPRRNHTMLTRAQNKEIHRLLMRTNHGPRKIARMVGCAYSTVWLRCKRLRRRAVRGAETELRLVDREAECPKHGRVHVWPCVACAAEAARRGRKVGVRRRTPAM